MDYKFVSMNKNYANEIAYDWKYQGIYSFYDMTEDEEDLEEFLSEDGWKENYFAVLNEHNELIGFYSFYFEADNLWIGFGLKPELTGRGLGGEFVQAGIDFGIEKFKYKKGHIFLAVAEFNKRAIKTYENIGFKRLEEYMQKTNGSKFAFVKMRKKLYYSLII